MDDAYEKIGSIVEKWCEENMYTTMLVTISIGYEWETPHEETHLLEWDFESWSLVWEVDWWEGQQHVELVGFAPTYKIRLVGAGAEVATVRHGRWIQKEKCYPEIEKQMDFRFECSECGFSDIHNATLDVPYCWHCGAKMDKGEQT